MQQNQFAGQVKRVALHRPAHSIAVGSCLFACGSTLKDKEQKEFSRRNFAPVEYKEGGAGGCAPSHPIWWRGGLTAPKHPLREKSPQGHFSALTARVAAC